MWQLLRQVFGSRNQRLVKEMSRVVASINALEPEMKGLADEQFAQKTQELKARFTAGAKLDDLVPEAFALVREASLRKLGMRPFDVQLIGGLALNAGKIAEMRTRRRQDADGDPAVLSECAHRRRRACRDRQRIPGAARFRLEQPVVPIFGTHRGRHQELPVA